MAVKEDIGDGSNLYQVLGVESTATLSEIRKAYHKLALRLHPDKNPDDQQAKDSFQKLQRVYEVLSDPEKRKFYDETGSFEGAESGLGDDLSGLQRYFSGIFATVEAEDIDNFAEQFKGSDEEKEDILKYVQRFKGDMTQVFEWVMLSDPQEDSHRFMDIIEEQIGQGNVKCFKLYAKWRDNVQSRKRPTQSALEKRKAKKRKANKNSDDMALIAAIKGKGSSSMNSMLANLEAKYCNTSASRPSEEQFDAARKRLDGKVKQKRKKERE